MTPERLRECQALLAMSDSELAGLLAVDARLLRRWKSGAREIPDDAAACLEGVVEYRQERERQRNGQHG